MTLPLVGKAARETEYFGKNFVTVLTLLLVSLSFALWAGMNKKGYFKIKTRAKYLWSCWVGLHLFLVVLLSAGAFAA